MAAAVRLVLDGGLCLGWWVLPRAGNTLKIYGIFSVIKSVELFFFFFMSRISFKNVEGHVQEDFLTKI